MKRFLTMLMWVAVAVLGAAAYAVIAFQRGEPLNAAWMIVAAVCTYTIGYRFYSKWIAAKVLALNDLRATPAEVHDDGRDFVKTNPWIVFGHHFAAISGPRPLVGPVLAAQFGYLLGMLWILIGVVLGGAATLAVGMAHIFAQAVGKHLLDLVAGKVEVAKVAATKTLIFNNQLDAVVAGIFLTLVIAIMIVSVREWALLLLKRKPAALREANAVWLPPAVANPATGRPWWRFGTALLLLGGLIRELTGEAAAARTKLPPEQAFVATLEHKYNSKTPHRCC